MAGNNGGEKSENNAKGVRNRRRPGRPAGGNKSADKRDLLLDSALKLFSTQGIAQTSLSAITADAGVTSAMLHYYFKNREQLLDVLIDERYLPVRSSMGGVFEQYPDDPVKALTALTQKFITVSLEHPWFAPLWIREVLSESGLLRERIDARAGIKEKKSALMWIQKWQDEGRLNPGLQPEFLFISLFGLTLLPVARLQHEWRKGERSLTAQMLSRHIEALLTSGVGGKTAS
ncbi:TetR/AcrR family transcriptional regulator [Cedecea colo]|uniref:TetR/AcrR family transcriptional regulator n=1 Tax=Cedecea colo TaxID=2552946 RepID=A0ABX0VPU7_9ENTR|nr:TetR/AcrR family transcriptional regulator [Cedecea colo]NIY49114.1 TetR/AcrR family transcriptional regulator [Cedecea colo]